MSTYRYIDEGDARPEVGVRLNLVNESMLSPVASHQSQAHESERDQEHERRRTGIDKAVHQVQEDIVTDLASRSLKREIRLACTQEVHRQIEPNQKVESTNVLREVPNTVPLVADSGRKVVGSVAFNVVMLDVVIVVRVPRVTHHWVENVWEQPIDKVILLAEDTAHMDMLMFQKSVCSHIVALHDAMEDSVPPMEIDVQVCG